MYISWHFFVLAVSGGILYEGDLTVQDGWVRTPSTPLSVCLGVWSGSGIGEMFFDTDSDHIPFASILVGRNPPKSWDVTWRCSRKVQSILPLVKGCEEYCCWLVDCTTCSNSLSIISRLALPIGTVPFRLGRTELWALCWAGGHDTSWRKIENIFLKHQF